jgi:cell division septum initiation protein DivIVA
LKKSFFKIAAPTLALGLAFTPMASAAPNEVSQKTVVTVKTVSKTTITKSDYKAKESVKKLTAKERDAIKKLAGITKNISKVETSIKQLSIATTNFYAKAITTPVSAKVEADFYSRTSGKLKANTNQLKALKKQVDHVAKKYKSTDAVTSTYKSISELNNAITLASKNLNVLHTQFQTTVKVEESKKLLTSITTHLTKVEASVAELSKATADFYAKAATDDTVTSKAETEFYNRTTYKLKAHTNLLKVLKKQLDYVAKYSKDADAVAVANKKITDLNSAITLAGKNLTDLHTQFQAKVQAEEAKKQLATITTNLTKVETSVAELSKATADFYAKAAIDATVTSKVEAEFYTHTTYKLKANTNLLIGLKKQVDYVAKYSKDTDALAVANKKITDLNNAIILANKNLTDLHAQFKAKLQAEEAKKQLATITTNLSKVETSVTELSKATVDFYTKAATDATVTAQVEAAFYSSKSGLLLTATKQLLGVKKQLDSFVKIYGNSADVTATYAKITAQNKAIILASEALTNYHTTFKPVATTK